MARLRQWIQEKEEEYTPKNVKDYLTGTMSRSQLYTPASYLVRSPLRTASLLQNQYTMQLLAE
ncbi:hypothetical protein N7486_000480 [Penicillium sp. IBT 16267x]|nr:hypothetical protein N7486_000480 [Penicillium sp. IBT 16267x]